MYRLCMVGEEGSHDVPGGGTHGSCKITSCGRTFQWCRRCHCSNRKVGKKLECLNSLNQREHRQDLCRAPERRDGVNPSVHDTNALKHKDEITIETNTNNATIGPGDAPPP